MFFLKKPFLVKVCVLVYHALHENAPVYIRDILPVYQPSCHLRSSENGTLLVVPRVRTEPPIMDTGPFLLQVPMNGTNFHYMYAIVRQSKYSVIN